MDESDDESVQMDGSDDAFEDAYITIMKMGKHKRNCYKLIVNNSVDEMFDLTLNHFLKDYKGYMENLRTIENIMFKSPELKLLLIRILNERTQGPTTFGSPHIHWLILSVGEKRENIKNSGSENEIQSPFLNMNIPIEDGKELFRLMIDCGADLHAKNTYGETLDDLKNISTKLKRKGSDLHELEDEPDEVRSLLLSCLNRDNVSFLHEI